MNGTDGGQPVRAVTWDAVGTLIAVAGSVGAVYARIARDWGVTAETAALDARFPEALAGAKVAGTVAYGADEADAQAFWTRVVRATFPQPIPAEVATACYDGFARAEAWRVLPGVRTALAAVARRGLPQAVVSNFDGRLPQLLAELDLGPFQAVITSAGVGAAKPDPTPLHVAARTFGLAPAAILHVGDSPVEDGGMATAAGCRFLLVQHGIDDGRLEEGLCLPR